MSFSRIMRPWVPTILFVTIVLLVMLAINYQTGSPYVLGDEEKTTSTFLRLVKGRIKPQANPNAHWREALPWSVDPKRFLPNYFTYIDIMKDTDALTYRKSNIVFVHVPRSGGTTMNTCLSKVAQVTKMFDHKMRFVNGYNLHVAHEDLHGVGQDLKVVVSGEFSFGSCDFMEGRPCSYALLMRDPYERVISSYAFCKHHEDDESNFYCSLKTAGMSIVDWAVLEGSPLFRQLIAHPSNCGENFENHFDFAGMINIKDGILKDGKYPCWMKLKAFLEHQLTEEQLDQVVEYVVNNIEYWFAVVGVLENTRDFLDVMQSVYYNPINNICEKVHKANNSVLTKDEKQRFRQELEASSLVQNALKADLALYKRVEEAAKLQGKKHFQYFHGTSHHSSHH